MAFTITGIYHQRTVRVTWQHGYLSGDAELIAEVQLKAMLLEGQPIGPVESPWTFEEHLCDAASAALLLRETLDVVTTITGERPDDAPC